MIARQNADHYDRVARLATRAGARTSIFSPDLELLFLAVPGRAGLEAELRVYAVR